MRVIAPSGPFDREPFAKGVETLVNAGLQPNYSERVFTRSRGFLAGNDDARLSELQDAIDDPDIDAIWIARGGYGATRLLHAIEPERVRRYPKWLVGFSDATALHALWAHAGVASMHGANVTTLNGWSDAARDHLFSMLCSEGDSAETFGSGSLPSLEYRSPIEEKRESAWQTSGVVFGGNLTVLAALCGTGILAPTSGDKRLLFVEDIAEPPYKLDRCVTQLQASGVLDGVAGVAIGQLQDCGKEALDSLIASFYSASVRAVGGFSVGHQADSSALPLGLWATLTAPSDGQATLRYGSATRG